MFKNSKNGKFLIMLKMVNFNKVLKNGSNFSFQMLLWI